MTNKSFIVRENSGSLLEGDVDPWFSLFPFGEPRNMMFVVNTCLCYFLYEELELSPPAKPPTMVLSLEQGAL